MNEQYYNLELNILSCLLQRPELMEEVQLEDKHFIKYKQLWLFMKSFYNKFKTFDIELMTSISSNKYRFIDYILILINKEPAPSLFSKYQEALIYLYNQKADERKIIDKIYELANDLYNQKIDLQNFKESIEQIIS